jgi:hypothetical protein
MSYGLWVMGYGLWVIGHGLWVFDEEKLVLGQPCCGAVVDLGIFHPSPNVL